MDSEPPSSPLRPRAMLALRRAARSDRGQLAALGLGSVLSLWPVLSQPGWPLNHESWVWVTRLAVLKQAWHRGELLPLWWKQGNDGLGSPMPALYHKLQNFVCTLFFELVGNAERAQVLSLLVFTFIGCTGLRRVALQLGASRWTATLHGLLLPFAGYVSADWLVRGAFAEHAAFMLLPWLIVGLLHLIEHGRVRIALLAGTMTALFYAHSVTALFSVGLIAIATVLALLRHPRQLRSIVAAGALSAAIFAVAVAPMVWVTSILVEPFYLEHTISGYYDVHRNLTNLFDALFVGHAPVISFWVAPDLELWLAIAAGGLLALPRVLRARAARPWLDPSLAFVIAGCGLMVFLRLEPARAVYDHVPGLRYIQFPWRLLAFITVLLIALSAALFGRVQARLATPLAAVVLAALAARSRVFHFHEARLSEDEMTAALDPNRYVKWWEYVPKVPGPASDAQLGEWARGPESLSDGCAVRVQGCSSCFVVECSAPGTVALPYAFSGLEFVRAGDGRGVWTYRAQRDARVRVDVDEGRTALRYRQPSWGSIVRRLLHPG